MIPLVLIAVLQAPPDAGATLVVVLTKSDAREYHTPACPLIRGVSDVAVMRKTEAEQRHYTPPRACHSDPPPKPAPIAVQVFVAKSDKYYHRDSCRRKKPDAQPMKLDDAGRRYWPCPVCRPPVRKRAP
jgi:hypothetical protein